MNLSILSPGEVVILAMGGFYIGWALYQAAIIFLYAYQMKRINKKFDKRWSAVIETLEKLESK